LNAALNITPTHGTGLQLTRNAEGVGHKLFMDNYFSPQLFSDLHNRKITSCGTVHHNRQGMPANFGPKTLKLKKGDIIYKVKGGISTVLKDKREVYFLTNMHNLPASGYFLDKEGNASKPL
jgi:hypothetical protein